MDLETIKNECLHFLDSSRLYVNKACQDLEAWQIIAVTFSLTLIAHVFWDFLFQDESLASRSKKFVFRMAKKLPPVRNKLAQEMEKTRKQIADGYDKDRTMKYVQKLPEKGFTESEVLEELKKYKALSHVDWTQGHCSGMVYSGEVDLTQLMSKVYSEFAWTNPLHPEVFPEIRKMEAEVVRMTCNMFNGGPDSCGAVTTGGTESILLACKAYRDMALERGIRVPEIVAPVTVHAAFNKAASYLRMKVVRIPIDKVTMKVNVKAMKRAINGNTCMLVGSAPAFPHGVIDPIKDISELAQSYGLPMHVDCCLGGFIVPFMRKCGFSIDFMDFRLPGVTSISADTHKYGFAPKGSAVIMYSHPKYRRYQYFAETDWPGGIYASPTISGSRAGAVIASCWATMMYMGEKGYLDSTKKIVNVARYIEEEIRAIPHLFVYGKPEASVVAFGSHDFSIYELSDRMRKRGWHLNPLQFPDSIHICCTLLHTKPKVADRFISDIREIVDEIMEEPKKLSPNGTAVLYGMAQSLPDRSIVSDITYLFYDVYYNTQEG